MLAELQADGVRDRAFLLRSLGDTFALLDDDGLRLLAGHARTRRFAAGECLIADTEPMRYAYLLFSGRVRVTYRGELLTISERPRGVGLLASRANKLDGTGAVALTDTTAFEVPIDALRTAYEENFALVRNDLRLCAGALLARFGGLPLSPDTRRTLDEGVDDGRALTLVERVLEMRKEPIFATVNLEAVIEIARRGAAVRYEAGERLWNVHDTADHYLRIDSGRVRCTAPNGQRVDVARGQVLGSFDALAVTPRSFGAVAVTPVTAFRTSIQALLTVMETQHELARGLLAILATTLLEAQLAANRQPSA